MRAWVLMCSVVMALSLSGCAVLTEALCEPHCNSNAHSSSSLVEFLYPDNKAPPREDAVPELHLPLRVGLAFLPAHGTQVALDAAHREQLLERIRKRFSDRKFVSEIVVIPDYYLAGRAGFEGLQGVQRLYGIDLMALVSYDQITHEDENRWSLGYLTIVGAYVLKGTRHDISTLVDLAVVDPVSRSLVLRAGGVDVRHGSSTLIDEEHDRREAGTSGFSAATDQMIDHFDAALTRFETDVRAGKANVRVVNRVSAGSAHGGVGAFSWPWIALLLPLVAIRGLKRFPAYSAVTALTGVRRRRA